MFARHGTDTHALVENVRACAYAWPDDDDGNWFGAIGVAGS
jgi:hypothetical protein